MRELTRMRSARASAMPSASDSANVLLLGFLCFVCALATCIRFVCALAACTACPMHCDVKPGFVNGDLQVALIVADLKCDDKRHVVRDGKARGAHAIGRRVPRKVIK